MLTLEMKIWISMLDIFKVITKHVLPNSFVVDLFVYLSLYL